MLASMDIHHILAESFQTNVTSLRQIWYFKSNMNFAMKLLIFAAIALFSIEAFSEEITGPATVVDGDSIRIAGTEIRLHGIDAPEWQQVCQLRGQDWACGEAARETLNSLSIGAQFHCTWSNRDRYNRPLATCFAKDTNLNDMMVRAGTALAYRQYSDRYIEQENQAREAKQGLWEADFVAPWDWRQCVRLPGNELLESQCRKRKDRTRR